VLSVGRLWDEAKNAQALADVAPQLTWPVRMAGDMRAPDGTERPLRNVQALGRCDAATLAWHYARAAIFAAPARYEPFGLSALEAALSGCALVLGDIPSQREIWEDTAVYVAPDDRDALREAINALIREPIRRKRLASRALARAREFTVERMARGYLNHYRTLLGLSSRSGFAPDRSRIKPDLPSAEPNAVA
jgi:glycosyltransferase involved in cell wall biosynthesis